MDATMVKRLVIIIKFIKNLTCLFLRIAALRSSAITSVVFCSAIQFPLFIEYHNYTKGKVSLFNMLQIKKPHPKMRLFKFAMLYKLVSKKSKKKNCYNVSNLNHWVNSRSRSVLIRVTYSITSNRSMVCI